MISSAVRLAPAAISHGNLVVRIDESPRVVSSLPAGKGRTETEEQHVGRLSGRPASALVNRGHPWLNWLMR